ncbi:MAG: ATP-grasp domain-containing protein [Bacteroidetes bacterium]|nr:ATP-grasp domain-containing protein [Bacteroidota bacterium]
MKKRLKVAIVYNEVDPSIYKKVNYEFNEGQDFVPYFEIDDIAPMEEYEIISRKLKRIGFSSYALNIKDDIYLFLNDIKKNRPDIIFNFIELFNDDATLEMNIVGLLELLGIPYTGAPALTLANCQSKILTKRMLDEVGIKTPKFIVADLPINEINHSLNYPVIVKPALEDASAGIGNNSIVTNNALLIERINYVLKYYKQPALIEEFIDGRELNLAILGDEKPRALPISEIDFSTMPKHLYNIVSYEAKWEPHDEAYHKTIPICPAILPKTIEKNAKEIAIKAFKTMQCRDYTRIDMRLSENNELFVLEVNPNPDLTEGAGFMRSMEAAGFTYAKALKRIIDLAYKRGKRKNNKKTDYM